MKAMFRCITIGIAGAIGEVQVALGALKHESDSGMLYRTRAGMAPWPKPKKSFLPMMTGAGVAVLIGFLRLSCSAGTSARKKATD